MEVIVRGLACGIGESFLAVVHLPELNRRVHRQLERQRQATTDKQQRRRRISLTVASAKTEEEGPRVDTKSGAALGLCSQLARCVLVNGGILGLSGVFFYAILLPLLEILALQLEQREGSHALHYALPTLQWLFEALWLLPLMLLLELVNIFWFKDIADVVYSVTHGKATPLSATQLGAALADRLFGLVTGLVFLVQAWLVRQIPLPMVAESLYAAHVALLYALYVFEYRWYYQGVAFSSRISHIESQWPYFLGFGMPMALLTVVPSSYALRACFLSVVFPFYITSAQQARSYRLYSTFNIKVFRPSIYLSNLLLRLILRKSWKT